MTDPKHVEGDWLIVFPISGLEISSAAPIGSRWQVGDVEFVSSSWMESHLDVPLLPRTPNETCRQYTLHDDVQAYALIRKHGTPEELRKRIFFELRQACDVLASTAAFYGRRSHSFGFGPKGAPGVTAKFDSFFRLDGTEWCGNFNQNGRLHPFSLDSQWHSAISNSGIIDLFSIINNGTLDPNWRRQIKSGAAMLGRSQMSLELPDAFLMNVMGLETLLTTDRQRNGRMLAKRVKGMTGWYLNTHRANYQVEIEAIHSVRCEIVHDSDYSNLSTELLLLSDLYLSNSLLNIVRFPNIFPNKSDLMNKLDDFADNENWPNDGTLPFRWFGNSQFNQADLDLQIW